MRNTENEFKRNIFLMMFMNSMRFLRVSVFQFSTFYNNFFAIRPASPFLIFLVRRSLCESRRTNDEVFCDNWNCCNLIRSASIGSILIFDIIYVQGLKKQMKPLPQWKWSRTFGSSKYNFLDHLSR